MLIEISGVTGGQSPYDIFLCTTANTSCFFISGNTTIPPNIIIDSEDYFPGEEVLLLRLVDTNGCVHDELQDCSVPPPIVTEKSYEVAWGNPGVVTFDYEIASVGIRKTVTYPEFFIFSSSTEPSFVARSSAVAIREI